MNGTHSSNIVSNNCVYYQFLLRKDSFSTISVFQINVPNSTVDFCVCRVKKNNPFRNFWGLLSSKFLLNLKKHNSFSRWNRLYPCISCCSFSLCLNRKKNFSMCSSNFQVVFFRKKLFFHIKIFIKVFTKSALQNCLQKLLEFVVLLFCSLLCSTVV